MTRNVPPKRPIADAVETVQRITHKRGIGNVFANLSMLGKQPEVEAPIAPVSPVAPPIQAATQVVQQVAAEAGTRPAPPRLQPVAPNTTAATQADLEWDSYRRASAEAERVSKGPPPGYQYDPDEFSTPNQSIQSLLAQEIEAENWLDESSSPVQPPSPQAAKAVVQQVVEERSKPAPPRKQAGTDPFLDDRNNMPQVSEGPPPGYQYDPDEFSTPVQSAAKVVQQVQQNPIAAAVEQAAQGIPAATQVIQSIQAENTPSQGRVVQSSRSPSDWLLDENSPGPTHPRPQLRSPDAWVLDENSPGPTNQPSRDWVLDEDLPSIQAAAQIIQGVQGESLPGGSGGSYNAGAGGGGGGGGGSIPPEGRTTFSLPEPNDPDRPQGPVEKGFWNHALQGFLAQAGDKSYSDSVIGDTFAKRKFPQVEGSGFADKAAFLGGRTFADIQGYGTRKGFWNLTPEDAMGTFFREMADRKGLSAPQQQLARYASATTLGLIGGNYNPLNLAEGGRTEGFAAVNPTEEDPRKPVNAVGEFLFDRAMLGRTGRLLPWQEFHQERPDVSYDKYAAYQDYIRAPSFLGIIKGTMDGIDGPEARVVGSRVQPEAVAAALAAGAAVIGGFGHYNNKNKRRV